MRRMCVLSSFTLGLALALFVGAVCGQEIRVFSVDTSSNANLSSYLIDGDPSTVWRSVEKISPGRPEWIKLYLGGSCTIESILLTPSTEGGFPSSFEVYYSTDNGSKWYPVGGASFRGLGYQGPGDFRVDVPGIVANALKIEATYLRQDSQGGYSFRLSEVKVEGSRSIGPYCSSRGGTWDEDLDMMWRVFGAASDGTGAVPRMGGQSAWMEWNALKFCWSGSGGFRNTLKKLIANYPVDPDGYVWSWDTQRGWPTHGHRHYDGIPKFILAACRYYLWTGDREFLNSSISRTTDMSLIIGYGDGSHEKWSSANMVAIRLQPDSTLGQSFIAERNFTSVGGCFPTWLTTNSGMTLRLRKDGPSGQILAEKSFANVGDNSWIQLSFSPLPPGKYYLEMCCPTGTIGWWSLNDDRIPGGEAFSSGRPVVRDSRPLIEKVRSAMNYMLDQMQGSEGLAVIDAPESNGTHNAYPTDYWDNFPFGYESAYVNTYFYAALGEMAELEESLGNYQRADHLRSIRRLVRQRFNQVFWDPEKGRYIGCVDSLGGRHDYGFTYINTEAAAYGLADEEKARLIYSWLDGTRTVPGDFSTGGDIYHFKIAPRSTTIPVETVKPYWWYDINGAISLGPGGKANFGDHLENGGAIFYTSFYDLMGRLRWISADDSMRVFDKIMSQFHIDQLRRDPPNSRGIRWMLGVIGEFPESGIVATFPLYGLIGASARCDGLHIRPRLPQNLTWICVKNVDFRGSRYEINVSRSLNSPAVSSREGIIELSLPSRGEYVVNGENVTVVAENVMFVGIVAGLILGHTLLGVKNE